MNFFNSTCKGETQKNIPCKYKANKNTKNGDFCLKHKKGIYSAIHLRNIKKQTIKKLNLSIKNINNIKIKLLNTCNDNNITILKNTNKKIIQKLDNDHLENLMGINDSFNQIPLNKIIFLHNRQWDICFLLNHFVSQLNKSDLNNPKPMFFNNPFTRGRFTKSDILKIYDMIKINEINITLQLKILFDHIKIHMVDEDNKIIDFLPAKIIDLYSHELRYMRFNCKDSQGNYTGIWVIKNTPYSYFEILYKKWSEMPLQRTYFLNDGRTIYVDNDNRNMVNALMDSLNTDEPKILMY